MWGRGGRLQPKHVIPRRSAGQAETRRGDGPAGTDIFVRESGGSSTQANVIGAEHTAQGTGGNTGGRRGVINFVVRGDAGGERNRADGKGAAGGAGQAGSSGGQLFADARSIHLKIADGHGPVADASANIEGGSSHERAGAGAQSERHCFVGSETDGGIVAEGILSFDHRLRAKK